MDLNTANHAITLLLAALLWTLKSGEATIIGPEDYCSLDIFEPKCNNNEVVLITSALYGRMVTGKCIQRGAGNIGCQADAQKIMDSMCSGRGTCTVPAIHRDLFATKPCKDMLSYLSVAYRCQKVVNTNSACQTGKHLLASREPSYITQNPASCENTITSENGQLLNFTVFNFMAPGSSACYEVAVIKEKNNRKTVHICGNDARSKVIHLTSTDKASIEITQQTGVNFLLGFQATGCPQPTIPTNSHLERDGDRAKIKCNDSDNSWFIYCKDNKWTDHPRKCPKEWGITRIFKTESGGFPYGIFLTSFIAVGIGIFLGGFLLFIAINAFQRHQRRLRQAYESPPIIPDPDYKIYDTCKMDLNFVPGFGTAGRHTIARHQMSPPPVPSQPPEDERRFSRHTYEKPKYNSTDNSPFVDA